jgi:hypothetical protein
MAQRKKRDAQAQRQWRRIDLHLHTPASSDFQESSITFLDILQKAEARGLDIIAFTDHNSVAGYARLLREIDQLELLDRLKRINAEEKWRLEEYRRLRKKILVLPGFEFTATFGFHILGIFSEQTPVRVIEHILLNLNVPAEKLDQGATEVGATDDVLTAYRLIDEAGGIVIAAHVNSSHGVAMRGLDFGGQTKIAYTQDSHLHALEVTDLDSKSKRSTASFFNGSKPEYPRRMHCIQGSDSHRLNRDPNNGKNPGAFDRVTEILLPVVSFEALRSVLLGSDFALTRPSRGKAAEPFDIVKAAREAGPSIVQSFHDGYSQRGGKLRAVVADICAFANTNGGTIYIGVPDDAHKPPAGVTSPKQAMQSLRKAVEKMITPPIEVTFAVHESSKAKILQVNVPRGEDVPYAVEDSKIYVRNEAETYLAVRDEIVQIIQRRMKPVIEEAVQHVKAKKPNGPPAALEPAVKPASPAPIAPPRTGVEIVETEKRGGQIYHTVRDLRNGSIVRNVTRKSARKLWHYAITQFEQHPTEAAAIKWLDDLGLMGTSRRAGAVRYDLVQRLPDGKQRVYFGVTEDGVHGNWRKVVELDESAGDNSAKSNDDESA